MLENELPEALPEEGVTKFPVLTEEAKKLWAQAFGDIINRNKKFNATNGDTLEQKQAV